MMQECIRRFRAPPGSRRPRANARMAYGKDRFTRTLSPVVKLRFGVETETGVALPETVPLTTTHPADAVEALTIRR